jgi:hypothetical protein
MCDAGVNKSTSSRKDEADRFQATMLQLGNEAAQLFTFILIRSHTANGRSHERPVDRLIPHVANAPHRPGAAEGGLPSDLFERHEAQDLPAHLCIFTEKQVRPSTTSEWSDVG